jgi:hypothetical protein
LIARAGMGGGKPLEVAACAPAGRPSRTSDADEGLIERFQRAAFDYFLKYVNPDNGLIADTSRPESPASIAVVGFALSCYPIAVERAWMTRQQAIERTLVTLRFFRDCEQSTAKDASGYKGFCYHFLDMHSGRRVWECELSLIDSTLLLAGMLTAGMYFTHTDSAEREIRKLADDLYRRVHWRWAQGGATTARQGWKAESGFLHYGWEGYNEATLLYVLGLASPTHPFSPASYAAWTATYQWENIYGFEHLYAGPLFVHLYSHTWIDFAGIRDKFMREKKSDYFQNTYRAIQVQREYARRNPHEFRGYDNVCWGFSANEGPGPKIAVIGDVERRFFAYVARGAPFGPDDGTLAPGAMLGSLPFAPEIVLATLRALCTRYPQLIRDARLPGGFNPTLPGRGPEGWVSEGCYGLDQGLIVLMIENYRSGLIWRLLRRCRYIARGLHRAGFRGGWLTERAGRSHD